MPDGLLRSLLAAAAVTFMPASAAAQSSPAKEAIVPKGKEWAPNGIHFSPALRSGDLIFVSGVAVGLRPGETEADKEKAIDRAFQDIAGTLAEAGASWDDVIEITSYHTDFVAGAKPWEQQALFRKVKDRYVMAPYPAWTAIGASRLWEESLFAEISVIARARAKRR